MSWILRLEDQRVLRDTTIPTPVVAPPAPVAGNKVVLAAPPPPPPPPDLIRLLGDGEARVRRRAALAIGRVGLAEAVPNLTKVLPNDPDPEVRQMAAFALGLIGDASGIEALREALRDQSPLVAGRAAEALGLMGHAESAAPIGQVVTMYLTPASAVTPEDIAFPLSPEVEAFRLALYALARLRAADTLVSTVLAPDGQPRLRWWPVAYALMRVEDKRTLPALTSFVRSDSVYARALAARGLGALRDPSSVPALIGLLDKANAGSLPSIEAIRALGRIGDQRSVEPLMDMVRVTGSAPMVRAEVVSALGSMRLDGSPDFLLDLLYDPSPPVRAAALATLAKGEPDTFLTVLSGLDADQQWSVRAALATTLGTLEAQRALPLLSRMLSDADARVTPSVLTALTKLKAPDIAKTLIQRLSSDDIVVRMSAATNLGELKPEGAADALIAAYKRGEGDTSYVARAAALGALAKYGPAVAGPTLQAALGDRDWALRLRAAELLKGLDPSTDAFTAIRPAPSLRTEVSYDRAVLTSPPVSTHVYVDTDKGTIQIELAVLDAPLTCDTFVTLARKGFYDGLAFHRVVPDFVVQTGDPRGDGEGGPGFTIRDELNQRPYLRGTVGMALDWRDTGGSQFFITHSPQPSLDARYTVFGHVVSGMEVVDRLAQGDVIKSIRVWDGVQLPEPSSAGSAGTP